jgi:Methyltransferase domain
MGAHAQPRAIRVDPGWRTKSLPRPSPRHRRGQLVRLACLATTAVLALQLTANIDGRERAFLRYIAGHLSGLRAGRLLETAAGTGIATRASAANLPEAVVVEATDLNQAMIDHAARRLASPRVGWRQADAQALPFPDAMFGAVVCQFGVMFLPDMAKASSEPIGCCGRAEGSCSMCGIASRRMSSRMSWCSGRRAVADDPPLFLARTPHGHHDTPLIEWSLRRAGFGGVTVEIVAKKSTASSPRDPAIGFSQGTPMRNEIEARDPTRVEEATDVAAAGIASRFGMGQVAGQMRAYAITARR